MVKRIFILLVIVWCSYSFLVYAYSSQPTEKPTEQAMAGFSLWQIKNCQACHQLYGLGGYMGPDLTNIMSDSAKGPQFASAFIRAGTVRMPNFNFSDSEVNQLLAFLYWVDKGGSSIVPVTKVTWLGNYNLDRK